MKLTFWKTVSAVFFGSSAVLSTIFVIIIMKSLSESAHQETWLQRTQQCQAQMDHLEQYREDNRHRRWINKVLAFVPYEEPDVDLKCQSFLELPVPEGGDEINYDFLWLVLFPLPCGIIAWTVSKLSELLSDGEFLEQQWDDLSNDLRGRLDEAKGKIESSAALLEQSESVLIGTD